MAKININDILFATVIQCGRRIASIRLSGMTSFADIVRVLSGMVKGSAGMVTIMLRNGTQGWMRECPVILKG